MQFQQPSNATHQRSAAGPSSPPNSNNNNNINKTSDTIYTPAALTRRAPATTNNLSDLHNRLSVEANRARMTLREAEKHFAQVKRNMINELEERERVLSAYSSHIDNVLSEYNVGFIAPADLHREFLDTQMHIDESFKTFNIRTFVAAQKLVRQVQDHVNLFLFSAEDYLLKPQERTTVAQQQQQQCSDHTPSVEAQLVRNGLERQACRQILQRTFELGVMTSAGDPQHQQQRHQEHDYVNTAAATGSSGSSPPRRNTSSSSSATPFRNVQNVSRIPVSRAGSVSSRAASVSSAGAQHQQQQHDLPHHHAAPWNSSSTTTTTRCVISNDVVEQLDPNFLAKVSNELLSAGHWVKYGDLPDPLFLDDNNSDGLFSYLLATDYCVSESKMNSILSHVTGRKPNPALMLPLDISLRDSHYPEKMAVAAAEQGKAELTQQLKQQRRQQQQNQQNQQQQQQFFAPDDGGTQTQHNNSQAASTVLPLEALMSQHQRARHQQRSEIVGQSIQRTQQQQQQQVSQQQQPTIQNTNNNPFMIPVSSSQAFRRQRPVVTGGDEPNFNNNTNFSQQDTARVLQMIPPPPQNPFQQTVMNNSNNNMSSSFIGVGGRSTSVGNAAANLMTTDQEEEWYNLLDQCDENMQSQSPVANRFQRMLSSGAFVTASQQQQQQQQNPQLQNYSRQQLHQQYNDDFDVIDRRQQQMESCLPPLMGGDQTVGDDDEPAPRNPNRHLSSSRNQHDDEEDANQGDENNNNNNDDNDDELSDTGSNCSSQRVEFRHRRLSSIGRGAKRSKKKRNNNANNNNTTGDSVGRSRAASEFSNNMSRSRQPSLAAHDALGGSSATRRGVARRPERSKFANNMEQVIFQLSPSVKGADRKLAQQIVTELGGHINLLPNYFKRATHLICAPGPGERTEKYLAFRAAGKKIVTMALLLDSQERGYLLAEENYHPCPELPNFSQTNYRFSNQALFAGSGVVVQNNLNDNNNNQQQSEQQQPPPQLPFASWRVVLFAKGSVGSGISTILDAGGCQVTCLAPFQTRETADAEPEARQWMNNVVNMHRENPFTHVLVEADNGQPNAAVYVPRFFRELNRTYSLEVIFVMLCVPEEKQEAEMRSVVNSMMFKDS